MGGERRNLGALQPWAGTRGAGLVLHRPRQCCWEPNRTCIFSSLSRFPFYYELKIAFVAWLLSPYTKGSSLLYRKFVHPTLSSKEKEIDDCLVQAKDRSYDALVHFGKRGLNVAATAAVMAASKGQGALSERLRSFSMQDLTTIRGDGAPAPSSPPPQGSGRASGKHGQPKMSRSASESAGSSGTA